MYNDLALKNGVAFADFRFKHPHMQNFMHLEQNARNELNGLWRKITPDQLPHWYKKTKLKEFWKSRSNKIVGLAPPTFFLIH